MRNTKRKKGSVPCHKEVKEEIRGVDRKLTAEIRAVGDKVNRASERESALGQKVEGHEDRIQFLEKKAA